MNMLWMRQVVFSYWDFRKEYSYAVVAVCIIYNHIHKLVCRTWSWTQGVGLDDPSESLPARDILHV